MDPENEVWGEVGRKRRFTCPNISLDFYASASRISVLFRQALSDFILPWGCFFAVSLTVSSTLVLIRSHEDLTLFPMAATSFLTFCSILFCILGFPSAASVHTLSTEYLHDFNEFHIASLLTLEQKKRLRGFKPIKVHIGDQIFVRKVTALKMIHSMIYWTLRSLLIF